jgi:hypothetical protein
MKSGWLAVAVPADRPDVPASAVEEALSTPGPDGLGVVAMESKVRITMRRPRTSRGSKLMRTSHLPGLGLLFAAPVLWRDAGRIGRKGKAKRCRSDAQQEAEVMQSCGITELVELWAICN